MWVKWKLNRKNLLPISVFAHCPLCVAATGSAVAIARFYGVPDLITGSFIGAFILSIASWINRVLIKRNRGKSYFPFQSIVLAAFWLFAFLTIFSIAKLISFTLFDKLLLGILVGSFITLFAFKFNDFLREGNGNKNYIPFQVIFVTLAFLLLSVFGYYSMGFV